MARIESTEEVTRAAAVLRRGGTVAFPTETVYGLGADANNPAAVRKIFAIKRRPADHPLIVHLPSAGSIDDWAQDIPDAARKLVAHFWPGPLTLILKRKPDVPDVVTGGQDSVGLRVPNHPLAQALLAAFGGGIAAPSANRYGRVSATTAGHVRAELGDEVDMILEGACPLGIESTIVSFVESTPRLLRPGAIAPAALEAVLAAPLLAGASTVRTSGQHAAHYAPTTPLRQIETKTLWAEARRLAQSGRRVLVLHRGPAPLDVGIATLAMPLQPQDYAQVLYDVLRRADAAGAQQLLIERPLADESWLAIRDRLDRAETGSARTLP